MRLWHKVRRIVAGAIYWQWKKMGKLSSIIYAWLVKNGIISNENETQDD